MSPFIYPLVPSAEGNEFEVVECNENYCWAMPVKRGKRSSTPILPNGIPIEGGLPHYGHKELFGKTKKLSSFWLELPVADIPSGVSVFDANSKVLAGGKEIRGIGVYCNNPIGLTCGDVGETLSVSVFKAHPLRKGT